MSAKRRGRKLSPSQVTQARAEAPLSYFVFDEPVPSTDEIFRRMQAMETPEPVNNVIPGNTPAGDLLAPVVSSEGEIARGPGVAEG